MELTECCDNDKKKHPKEPCCPRFLLLPERCTGVPTDPTGRFERQYDVDPEELFEDSFAYAVLHKRDPLKLQIIMFAPKPEKIGFPGWRYEGWLVDQPPLRGSGFTSDPQDLGNDSASPHVKPPISTGIFKDVGLTLPNGLSIFSNKFSFRQSVWPYDSVFVTFEPPKRDQDEKKHGRRSYLVLPLSGEIPGKR